MGEREREVSQCLGWCDGDVVGGSAVVVVR